MEVNKKYKAIYLAALNKKAPESTDDCVMCCDENGNYKPATPIGYEPEQLEFDALHDVIDVAFTKDKDYVCWSDGGYSTKTDSVFETKEGAELKAYDPVLLLGNLGEPLGFMMFTGDSEETEHNENGSYYITPIFKCFDRNDNVIAYKPKVYVHGHIKNSGLKKLAEMKRELIK